MLSPEVEQRLLDQLICHYHDSYPKEAVGVVLNDSSTIRLRNRSSQPNTFRTLGLNLLGTLGWKGWMYGHGITYLYHSHRQVTSPSQTDQAFMKVLYERWPHVRHLIFTPDRRYDIWEIE